MLDNLNKQERGSAVRDSFGTEKNRHSLLYNSTTIGKLGTSIQLLFVAMNTWKVG